MKGKHRMRLEVKEISEQGTFEGLLSPYGNVDQGGDIVEPGAYSKTLKDNGSERPLLWQHKSDEPIGMLTLEDRGDGLWCKGQLLMDLPTAKKAYLLMKARVVKGLSVGYDSIKDNVENGVRHLKEIALWEGSVVTFPMNLAAQIVAIKGRETKDDFNTELAEIQLGYGAWQMQCALDCSLNSVLMADMTRDEKVSAAETTIQQFSDAYLAFLPQYLDMMTADSGGMEAMGGRGMQTKAGRRISAATKAQLSMAHQHMSAATGITAALLADEAGDDPTSEPKAAPVAPEQKSEPVTDHSAVLNAVTELKEILTWN